MADFEFAPIFQEDENSVRARLFADVQEGYAQVSTRVLDLREGSPLWLMLAGPAKELARAYQSMNDIAELAFVPFLQDDFLTDKAMEYGLIRLTEREANGRVSFYGDAGTSVPIGAEVTNMVQFADDQVYSFTTREAGVIPATAAPLVAPIVAGGGPGALTGSYSYRFTYVEVDVDGQPLSETAAGPASGNHLASNSVVAVSGFPIPPVGHNLRLYRTPSSGTAAGVWKLVAEFDPATGVTVFQDSYEDYQIGSYFAWDGDAGTEFDATRQGGPIIAPTLPSVILDVVAAQPGDEYNMAAGDVTVLADGLSGISTVMNHRPFITGRDDEPDDFFKPKVLDHIQKPQGAGNVQDYIDWLLEVPGFANVTVNPHFDGVIERPGYVHCVVRDENNDPVPNDMLTIAREGGIIAGQEIEALDPSPTGSGKGRAPIGAKVILQTVRKDFARVAARIVAKPGYALVPAAGQINLRVLIDASLSALLNNLPPGATIYESMIVQALLSTEGVEDVDMNLGSPDDSLNLDILAYDPLLPGYVSVDGTIATRDPVTGTWTLGRTEVLEYDALNSSITEV
jgi:uncharacterized phage protein gp47/JayE